MVLNIGLPKGSLLQTIYFELDKTQIKGSEIPKLETVLNTMKQQPGLKIEISGHTCALGEIDYNQILSKTRADVVCDYLAKQGIDRSRAYGSRLGLWFDAFRCRYL